MITVNPLLSPPGAYLFQAHLRGVLNRDGGLKEEGSAGRGALFYLERQWYQLSLKNQNTKWRSLKTRLEVMQPRIRIKSELPVGKSTIPDQSTRSFTVMID